MYVKLYLLGITLNLLLINLVLCVEKRAHFDSKHNLQTRSSIIIINVL
jgi:hypothetical protein